MKIFISVVFATILLLYGRGKNIYNELGISVGTTSIEHDNSYKFSNAGVGMNFQISQYMVSPRFDLEYVNIDNRYNVGSLLKGSINAVYEFEQYMPFLPYALIGFGYERVTREIDNSFENHPFIHAGGGFAYRLKNGYKAKLEGKILQIMGGKDEDNEASISFGMSFPIGIRAETKTIIKQKTIVKYKYKKVPIKRVSKPKVMYIDRDRCPKKISAPDKDRDGIADLKDQCPNTPCGFLVDGYGCPIKTTLRINFATGSSKIEYGSIHKVEKFAQFLLANRGSNVRIVGHTDSVGSRVSNLRLSKRRARAVVNKLLELGVSSSRIGSEGRGESSPIASNKTEYGRRENRRIEAILSYPNKRR